MLREQVRSLSRTRNLEEGRQYLACLLRNLFSCDTAGVYEMGQGLSGARVFHVVPKKGNEIIREYVLKLSPIEDLKKVRREIEKYAEAQAGLNHPYSGTYAPRLDKPVLPHSDKDAHLQYAMSFGAWMGICYDFLGGKQIGTVIDLETALVASRERLTEKTKDAKFAIKARTPRELQQARVTNLERMLNWLCERWYKNQKDGLVQRKVRRVWETEDLRDGDFEPLPPYRLRGNSKGHILGFLESREAIMGKRFFLEGWEKHREAVEGFVEKPKGPTSVKLLDNEMCVVLSPSHGDLNANNILLWLDYSDHPFLIDFPFYQKSGHALQDLARLEVEIKFALMDRQEDSPENKLRAFDLTPSQLPLWQAMEDHLLSEDWGEEKRRG